MEVENLDSQIQLIGKELQERIDRLATISDDATQLTRILFSPAMDRAAARISQWMQSSKLQVRQDILGNVSGYWEVDESLPTIHLGSHYDTVVNAGKFDGSLGVLIGIAAIDVLRNLDYQPKHNLSVLAFCDEEGVRFQSTFLGSASLSGQLSENDTKLVDKEGRTFSEWIISRASSVEEVLSSQQIIFPKDFFIETHIEQGPVLENLNLPVGVFTSIAAQMRLNVDVIGKAGHAGTTPINLRRDALTATAEMIYAVEDLLSVDLPVRATVGQIQVSPNVSNVIPDKVRFSIDLRTTNLDELHSYWTTLNNQLESISQKRNVGYKYTLLQETADAQCDEKIRNALKKACLSTFGSAPEMLSGAGHDAMKVSKVCPMGMLAVRSREGLSHHPNEYSSQSDIEVALKCLVLTIIDLDQNL